MKDLNTSNNQKIIGKRKGPKIRKQSQWQSQLQ